MTTTDPYASITTRATPQGAAADPRQVPNSAGGYTFVVEPEDRLRRFLILGSDQPTYYATAADLTADNARALLDLLAADPRRFVDVVVAISEAGRAPKVNPALVALAMACKVPTDVDDRRYAHAAIPRVVRTGSHLLTFVGYLEQFGGWGRMTKRAIGDWYNGRTADEAAYQVVKYGFRGQWSQRDVLRLARPMPASHGHDALYGWATKNVVEEWTPAVVLDRERAAAATTGRQWADIVADSSLSWEMLPDAALGHVEVWEALLHRPGGLPLGALLRQLPRLTRNGTLASRGLAGEVVDRLTNVDLLRRARIHPVNVLVALSTYGAGVGRGGNWTPLRWIVDALDEAFYASFGVIEPTGKRILIALDCSASMTWPQNTLFGPPRRSVRAQMFPSNHGSPEGPLTARAGAAAMAMATARAEDDYTIVGFTCGRDYRVDSGVSELPISPRQRLDDVVRTVADQNAGSTDCALPFLWAAKQREPYDAVVTYTDNETWAGDIHPHQALQDYRQRTGRPVRSIVVGMTSTGFSIADPSDAGSLDVVGFDSATPQLVSEFAAGAL